MGDNAEVGVNCMNWDTIVRDHLIKNGTAGDQPSCWKAEVGLLKFFQKVLSASSKSYGVPSVSACATSELPLFLDNARQLTEALSVETSGVPFQAEESLWLNHISCENKLRARLDSLTEIWRKKEEEDVDEKEESYRIQDVDREDGRDLCYSSFVHKYMSANRPVIVSNLIDNWLMKKSSDNGGWLDSSCETVDMDHLISMFGKDDVPIKYSGDKSQPLDCLCEEYDYLNRSTSHIPFDQFARLWKSKCVHVYLKDWHLFLQDADADSSGLVGSCQGSGPIGSSSCSCRGCAVGFGSPGSCRVSGSAAVNGSCSGGVGLKLDVSTSKEELAPIPNLFVDDWLNNDFLPSVGKIEGDEKVKTDYRFVYLGCKGTKTMLHADVINTYSWSANICGVKRWLLLPPEDTHLLYDCLGENVAPSFYSPHQTIDEMLYPRLKEAQPLQVIQQPGETIFVPSGWYHTVENLQDTLSVNANWCNSYNLIWCLARLEKNFARWRTACQRSALLTMQTSSSLNTGNIPTGSRFSVNDFVCLLKHKLEKVSQELDHQSPLPSITEELLHTSQNLFNLRQILIVATNISVTWDKELSIEYKTSLDKIVQHSTAILANYGYRVTDAESILSKT